MEHIHNVLLDEGGGGGSEGDDGHPWELLLKTSQLQEVRSVLMRIFAVLTIDFLTEVIIKVIKIGVRLTTYFL